MPSNILCKMYADISFKRVKTGASRVHYLLERTSRRIEKRKTEEVWRRTKKEGRKKGRRKERWWQEEGGKGTGVKGAAKERDAEKERERKSSFISAKFSWRIMARIQCTDANSRSCAECGAPFDYLDCTWAPPEFVSKRSGEEVLGWTRIRREEDERGRRVAR